MHFKLKNKINKLYAIIIIINTFFYLFFIKFNESLQPALKTIAIMMAAFSEVYYNENGMLARANTAWNCKLCVYNLPGIYAFIFCINYIGSKYMLNPELRARRIVNVIQYSSIEFYKAFLFLGETGNFLKY